MDSVSPPPQAGEAHDVGPVSDLTPGEGRAYAVDGAQIAVFLLDNGELRATSAVCPHKAGPIADGQVDLGVVVCPLHQYAFSLASGLCTSEGVGRLAVYSAWEQNGRILVSLGG
ncbi:MAG: Rieske (2Fe-2S) protein [Segniliparus sp.]|uniref:Rieske (2Fe-2S) protein n=1 Tax=Segniliparus sp. TaxID=2804064 RepID=UPI003F2CC643